MKGWLVIGGCLLALAGFIAFMYIIGTPVN